MNKDGQVITLREAAEILRKSVRQVLRYIAEGRLVPVSGGGHGHKYLLRRSDVEGLNDEKDHAYFLARVAWGFVCRKEAEKEPEMRVEELDEPPEEKRRVKQAVGEKFGLDRLLHNGFLLYWQSRRLHGWRNDSTVIVSTDFADALLRNLLPISSVPKKITTWASELVEKHHLTRLEIDWIAAYLILVQNPLISGLAMEEQGVRWSSRSPLRTEAMKIRHPDLFLTKAEFRPTEANWLNIKPAYEKEADVFIQKLRASAGNLDEADPTCPSNVEFTDMRSAIVESYKQQFIDGDRNYAWRMFCKYHPMAAVENLFDAIDSGDTDGIEALLCDGPHIVDDSQMGQFAELAEHRGSLIRYSKKALKHKNSIGKNKPTGAQVALILGISKQHGTWVWKGIAEKIGWKYDLSKNDVCCENYLVSLLGFDKDKTLIPRVMKGYLRSPNGNSKASRQDGFKDGYRREYYGVVPSRRNSIQITTAADDNDDDNAQSLDEDYSPSWGSG